MANLIIVDTGLDHLYPDGVPIIVTEILMTDVYKKVTKKSALSVLADPYFSKHSNAQKFFSELHPEGDRLTKELLEDGAREILPVFTPLQRWIPDVAVIAGTAPRFEFDTLGKIIYRWQNMDTRLEYDKLNYTSNTLFHDRIDPKNAENVKKYLQDALEDYVLKELYRAIGYDKKYVDYTKSYEHNRQQVAFWAKSDTSLLR